MTTLLRSSTLGFRFPGETLQRSEILKTISLHSSSLTQCINRAFWDQIQVIDRRDANTNEEMFAAVQDHLRQAGSGESIPALATLFRPQTPTDRGPRIWNDLLLRYAGYPLPDGSILGDPSQQAFTQMVQQRFHWEPAGERTAFDTLPVVIQVTPPLLIHSHT